MPNCCASMPASTTPISTQQMDRKAWPALKEKLAPCSKRKTRDEWCALMEGTDVCFAPVLTMAEAPQHPHMAARKTFVELDGVVQPAPAPRFSRTPGDPRAGGGGYRRADERVEGGEVESRHRAPDAVQRVAVRCRAGAHGEAGSRSEMGPGSALHRKERCNASGTRK